VNILRDMTSVNSTTAETTALFAADPTDACLRDAVLHITRTAFLIDLR
jgi:hypothetical protein